MKKLIFLTTFTFILLNSVFTSCNDKDDVVYKNIVFDKPESFLLVGESVEITATDEDGIFLDGSYQWIISDTELANLEIVNNTSCRITAKKAGNLEIKIKKDNTISSSTCKITIGVGNENYHIFIKDVDGINQVCLLVLETGEIRQLTHSQTHNKDLFLEGNIIRYTREGTEFYQDLEYFVEYLVNPLNKIVCWGNSLTNGAGTDGLSYPDVLSQLTGLEVVNKGIGGQWSSGIIARQGGLPILISVENNLIPASGKVKITGKNINFLTAGLSYTGEATGSILEIHGKIISDNAGNWTFIREEEGEAKECPENTNFLIDTFDTENYIAVFWVGNNNIHQVTDVLEHNAAGINHLKPLNKKYVVLAMVNNAERIKGTEDYDNIIKINENLKQTYQNNYIDVRKILIDSYDPNNPEDVEDYKNDVIPSSLRFDIIHLNNRGIRIVANAVYEKMKELEWL